MAKDANQKALKFKNEARLLSEDEQESSRFLPASMKQSLIFVTVLMPLSILA